MTNDIARAGNSSRCADHIVHNSIGYFVEVPPNANADFATQVKETFASLDAELSNAGTDKSKLLMVTIYLPNIDNITEFNTFWDQWLEGLRPPVRACVEVSRLADQGYGLELAVTAAV